MNVLLVHLDMLLKKELVLLDLMMETTKEMKIL